MSGKVNNNRNNSNRKVSNKKGRRNARRRRVNNGLSQAIRVSRSEVFFTGKFTSSQTLQIYRKSFDPINGPQWFKKMCGLYEKYKIHGIKLKIVFGGSKLTKGTYVLSYNTNKDQAQDAVTYDVLMAQAGAKEIAAASVNGTIKIKPSGLTGFSTTLPTSGISGYAFDAVVAGVPPEDVNFTVHVIYDVTFINPQCIPA